MMETIYRPCDAAIFRGWRIHSITFCTVINDAIHFAVVDVRGLPYW